MQGSFCKFNDLVLIAASEGQRPAFLVTACSCFLPSSPLRGPGEPSGGWGSKWVQRGRTTRLWLGAWRLLGWVLSWSLGVPAVGVWATGNPCI